MLRSSIATWWGVATGLIGIISFTLLSEVVNVNRLWITAIILSISFFIFIAVSILIRSWSLYLNSNTATIKQIVKAENEHIFLLEGIENIKIGILLEVYRIREYVEVPIGLIEVSHQREDGLVQAKPVWIMPVHLRDIETRELSPQSLVAYQTLSKETLSKWVDTKAEQKVQFLMKRGMK
jgi:hypothetical protein